VRTNKDKLNKKTGGEGERKKALTREEVSYVRPIKYFQLHLAEVLILLYFAPPPLEIFN
jgi:hypothetical protein